MVEAIANLAIVIASDRASIASLTATISTLTAEVAASHAKLVVALQDNAKLASTIVDLHCKVDIVSPSSRHDNRRHYFWTYGYRRDHSSSKCTTPAPVHQKSATKSNTQKGLETNKGT